MCTAEEIYPKVVRVLTESLNVEENDIVPTATLQGDLGADSIDFLDIVFRLEREFGIKIPRGELFPESVFRGDPDFVQDGRVTERGMRELRARMPFADLGPVERDRQVTTVPQLYTVGLVTSYIAWKLAQPVMPASDGNGAVFVPATPALRQHE
jgi:acyl carrier protein